MTEIYQGGNSPIILTFSDDVSSVPSISIGLYTRSGSLMKQWEQSDLTIEETTITCPISQAESSAFDCTTARLLVKMKATDGSIIFYSEVPVAIVPRKDRSVEL